MTVLLLASCAFFSGCATVNHMAVDSDSKSLDVSEKSVLLMSVELSRPEATRYTAHPMVVYFETPNAQSKEERQNFKIDGDAGETNSSRASNVYLVRMALKPGPYKLQGILGDANAFPFHGFFFVPLYFDVTVPAKSVVYLGRVKAAMRPRVGNEFRAGSLFPLIDQAATGVSGSTFDVTIEDRAEEDLAKLRSAFPVLARMPIGKSLLPPFDRALAQRKWENNPDNAKAEKEAVKNPPPADKTSNSAPSAAH